MKARKVEGAIFNDIVNADILEFIEMLKLENKYIYCANASSFLDILDYIKRITQILRQDTIRLLIYYSGHATEKCLILPNQDIFSESDVGEHLLAAYSQNDEILLIFDCCHGSNFNLPFTYQNKFHHPTFLYTLSLDPAFRFYPAKIVLFSSSSNMKMPAQRHPALFLLLPSPPS